ncbi:MAG TPA: hypothetical protein VGC97_10065 [Pyrinomonadaceae bacterium]|jgi:hypothetical protein
MLDHRQTSESPSQTGIIIVLEIGEPIVVGLSVLATVHIINRGNEPQLVSSRLNLMEGDVQFLVTDPGGSRQKIFGAGGQPDTAMRRVRLEPGQQIAASINLLYTSVGDTLRQPGTYTFQAVYYTSPDPPISSNEISITARIPLTESEQQVASILRNEAVKRAITLSEANAAPSEIQELAARFGDTVDGKLALLLMSEAQISSDIDSTEKINSFLSADPITAAFFITALSSPFSNVGKRLKEALIEFLTSNQTDNLSAASDVSLLEKALKIVSGQAFDD